MAKSTDTPTGWYPGVHKVSVPNFTRGRGGQVVLASTQHVTAGKKGAEFPNCITWFQNPAAEAAAHFLFGKQGEIVQFVSIDDTAWANGLQYATAPKKGMTWAGEGWYNAHGHKCFPTWPLLARPVSPNLTTVSMEHEGQSDEPWTVPMFNATVDVLRWLGAARRIVWTPHRTLIGHHELDTADRRNCPGPHVEWERLAAAANLAVPTSPPLTPPRPLTARYRLAVGSAVFTDRRPDAPLARIGGEVVFYEPGRVITVGDITAGWAWDASQIGFVPMAVMEGPLP